MSSGAKLLGKQSWIHKLFVERRPEGDYAVRKPNSERASTISPTQAEAIGRARDLSHGKAQVFMEEWFGGMRYATDCARVGKLGLSICLLTLPVTGTIIISRIWEYIAAIRCAY